MGKKAGTLTVGSLIGKRPPTAYTSSPVPRPLPGRPPKAARPYCCGSGCAGCPYMGTGFSS